MACECDMTNLRGLFVGFGRFAKETYGNRLRYEIDDRVREEVGGIVREWNGCLVPGIYL